MAKEEPMWRSEQLRGKNTVGFVMKEDGVDEEGKARLYIAPDTEDRIGFIKLIGDETYIIAFTCIISLNKLHNDNYEVRFNHSGSERLACGVISEDSIERYENFLNNKDTDKAQSHSDGKPSLCDVWRWLDQDFLLECAEQMKFPVEVIKKYPKDNWKQGVGDEQFIKARLESAQRHLTKLINSDIMKEAKDDETNKHETVCVMVNMMMMHHSMFGGNK